METPLNLPSFDVKVRRLGNQLQIFDCIRSKYVALTPEEWVRQHFINYLVAHKQFPAGLIAVEHPVELNGMLQRVDIVAFSRNGSPLVVVECKATSVKVNRETYEQASRYNLTLRAPYLVVTNGIQHFCSRIDLGSSSFQPLGSIPDYNDL